MTLEELKFPIGKFIKPKEITTKTLAGYINDIFIFPTRLRVEVANLSNDQLDTTYRTDGWTIRQVVHHCADSHMNSLIRFKLALTEEKPVIKPYYEDRWAELSDSKSMPIESSIKILEGTHERWIELLKGMTKEQLSRSYIHPEHGRELRLDESAALYAWHGKHHLAHIATLKKIKGWD
jgi:hypothetical protein